MLDQQCLWVHTANQTQPRFSIEETIQADVAIIGAGFTGLLAAYHLQKMGFKTVVLEKEAVGAGASGLNGGMLIPGFRQSMDKITETYGIDAAGKMLQFQLEAVDLMKEIVFQHKIDCSLTVGGYLKAAHEPAFINLFKKNQEFMYEKFGYETFVVEGSESKDHLNSDLYCGGLIDPNGMNFHPLNYAFGMANVIEQMGGLIFEQSPVTKIERTNSDYILLAPKGRVKASQVIVATNGYTTGITPKLKKSIIPKNSYVIATEPLAQSVAQQLLPSFKSVSDTKPLLYYFRLTPDNRMLFGGSVDEQGLGSEAIYSQIHNNMLSVFPQLKNTQIEFKWGGKVAATADQFPHIGITDNGVHYAMGYNGRGALLSTMMGKLLALNVKGEKRELNPLENIPLREIYTHSSI